MATPPDWSHMELWPGQPDDVGGARRFVSEHLLAHLLQPLVDDAQLVVSELATNAVQHAGTAFIVTLARCEGGVEIAVSDGSWMSDPTPYASTFGLGGRGLSIVDHVSRDWGVRTDSEGGKSVWAVLAV
jgi:anti-sigma regulatory factor (Ser/Thr protein kinase)